MANPQKENGYTPIANEILDAFAKTNLSPYEWRIVFIVIRYSYGWNKKIAKLTCTQIARLTGIDVRLIPRTLGNLQRKNIIVRDRNTFRLQKDYHKWFSSVEMSSVEMKKFICRDDKSSSVEMKPTTRKRSNGNGLRKAKDIPKDSLKDISQRETLLKRLKRYFPYVSIPANVPSKRIDFFLYLIEQNKINPSIVENPVKYIQSHKLVIEPFPSLMEREAEKKRLERERDEKLKKKRAGLERLKNENQKEMQQLISKFHAQLEGKDAVSV
jgi:phage replication O-like protein O